MEPEPYARQSTRKKRNVSLRDKVVFGVLNTKIREKLTNCMNISIETEVYVLKVKTSKLKVSLISKN